MFRVITQTLFLVTSIFVGQAMAGDAYLLKQAFFEDKSNLLTVDQVRSEKFTPYDGWLAKGYSSSTFWVRLTIAPSNQDLVLRIRPSYAESLQIFNASDPNPKKIVGAKYPWKESDIAAYSHNFKLGADQEERQFYLKVKYARTYLLDFNVMPLSEYLRVDHMDGLLYMGYVVFIFALSLGLFGAWLTNRELVLGVFTIQQFVAFLHTLFVVGYARIFFDAHIDVSTINYFNYVLVVCYPLVGALANKLLFTEYGLKRSYRYVINGILCASVITIGLLIFGYTNEALRLNAQIVMFAMLIFCLAAWFGTEGSRSTKNINLPINVLRLYYALNAVMWLSSVLPLLGLIEAKEFTIHSYLLYNMFSGLTFFLLLQYRAKSILKNELIRSNALKKEAENEKFMREEQGKLMAMLTHEIRTPLSVLKLVIDRKVAGSDLEGYANRAVSNIDSIIGKCIQLDQLDFKVLKVNKLNFNVSELISSTAADFDGGKRVCIQASSAIEIFSDIDIVRVIISNLIGNAIRYSTPDSDIHLILEKRNSDEGVAGVWIEVNNNVSSVDIPDSSRVFDKYYRGPSSSRISGSGLGLFLVKQLVQALQGGVQCSIINHSVTFKVWIPA